MANRLAKAARPAFEIANLLDDAADAIRDRSRQAFGAGNMSLDDYRAPLKTHLRHHSDLTQHPGDRR